MTDVELDWPTGSDGSDSDATPTSSTEHLTREEKLYVLRHTPRQEPQGQESKSWQQQQRSPSCRSCSHHQRSGSVNRLESSGGGGGSGGSGGPIDPASSCRTLIIHGSLSDESWARYGFFCLCVSTRLATHTHTSASSVCLTVTQDSSKMALQCHSL